MDKPNKTEKSELLYERNERNNSKTVIIGKHKRQSEKEAAYFDLCAHLVVFC